MYSFDNEGIILLDKSSGITSFQAVYRLKKILKIKKIGHSGTLDSNATGLLIIAIGKATKLLKHIIGQPKKYIAEFYFGIQTNTDDVLGTVIKKYKGKIDLEKIKKFLPEFTGKIKQIPPDFSAVHVNGKRAYKIAIGGEKPDIKAKEIEIKNINLISFISPILKLEIECSSGTYIRSIARDIGIKTEYYAHLCSLRRLSIGNFSINNASTLTDIESGKFNIITPYESLDDLPSLEVQKEFIDYIKNGRQINNNWFKDINNINLNNGYYKVHFEKKLLAVIKFDNEKFLYG